MIFKKKCKDWVDREENMYTNFGLSGKASEVLWEMMKESGSFSSEVRLLLSKNLRYYKSINDVVNIQVRRHFLKLIRDESVEIARNICLKYRSDAETFLLNVLSQMYKRNLEKIK
jgi:hypothetical protein